MKNPERYVKLRIEKLKKSKTISKRNQKFILKFVDECYSEALKPVRVAKYLLYLPKFAETLNKDFDKVTKEDMKKFIGKIEQSTSYSAWTKYDIKVIMKKFYKWLLGDGEMFPEQVRWIKSGVSLKDVKQISPAELLSEEDISKMIDSASNIRDKALIAMLYESGFSKEDFLCLKLKNVDMKGVVPHITCTRAKTNIVCNPPITQLAQYLANWLEHHPDKNNPEACLWVTFRKEKDDNGESKPQDQISYNTGRKILIESAEKAKVKRKVNFHNFRHSRATDLAKKGLNTFQLMKYFGWKKPSTANIYVHLAGGDLDDAVARANGIKPPETVKSKLAPKICPRCKVHNGTTVDICMNCGLPLTLKDFQEYNKEKEEFFHRYNEQLEKKIERMIELKLKHSE